MTTSICALMVAVLMVGVYGGLPFPLRGLLRWFLWPRHWR
jgi:hypothetical protein